MAPKTPVWKDTTSYGQNDTKRIPRTWTITAPFLTVTITRHIHEDPSHWFLLAPELFSGKYLLEEKDLEKAKAEAGLFLAKRLQRVSTSFLLIWKTPKEEG